MISGFRQKWRKTFQIDLKEFLNFIAAQLQILPVSSESYNDTERSVHVFMKRCHCIKGDHWFQTEVEEGISKLWRTPLKNGGRRLGENVHEDILISNLKEIEVESPDYDNKIMVPFVEVCSNREKPMSTVPLPN